MEKQTFIVDTSHDDLAYYYGEWHISGDLADFLDLNDGDGKKLKITIEVLED